MKLKYTRVVNQALVSHYGMTIESDETEQMPLDFMLWKESTIRIFQARQEFCFFLLMLLRQLSVIENLLLKKNLQTTLMQKFDNILNYFTDIT